MGDDYTFLAMHEINNRLFNNKFLSDIEFRFNVDKKNNNSCKILYAHTFELAKRSSVLFNQLINTENHECSKKIIIISDYDYDVYYQFIKFLYTDKCEIYYDNSIDLLKLSIEYKIFKLQNKLLDFVVNWRASLDFKLKVFNFIVKTNYSILFNWCAEIVSKNLAAVLECDEFLLIDVRTLEVILKLSNNDNKCTELTLFLGMAKWINNYCDENCIDRADRRKLFNDAIRLIRYPCMQLHEFCQCIEHEPDLLSADEISSIFETISLGEKYNVHKWISDKRHHFKWNLELKNSANNKLKFKVTEKRVQLSGIRIATMGPFISTTIEIAVYSTKLNILRNFQIDERNDFDAFVSFGETLILSPYDEYEIRLSYFNPENKFVLARSDSMALIFDKNFESMIEFSEDNPHVIELFFKHL